MDTCSIDPVLAFNKHLALFEETHQLIQEENRGLIAGRIPSRELLGQKEHLLQRLSAAVERIRSVRSMNYSKSDTLRRLRKQVQDKLMSILLLDRENEKLLLKLTGKRGQDKRPVSSKGTPSQVKQAYLQRLRQVSA